MRIRITSPGEYDRHDQVVRFVATIDGRAVAFSIETWALSAMREAMELAATEPLQVYQLGGALLQRLVEFVYVEGGADSDRPYFVSVDAAYRVIGLAEEGHGVGLKKWKR